jgi:hypothetical protein
MNAMCTRLDLLTHSVELHLVETDLSDLVTATLEGLVGACQIMFCRELRPLPLVWADPGQIQKVLTNLLLNAVEAETDAGKIVVRTIQMNSWGVLAVSDKGCGMSQEFVEHSLFEPFQTTKSHGLGIGMFHSKKIIEAHRGRIEVESVEGQGSTFRIYLPLVLQASNREPLAAVADIQHSALSI